MLILSIAKFELPGSDISDSDARLLLDSVDVWRLTVLCVVCECTGLVNWPSRDDLSVVCDGKVLVNLPSRDDLKAKHEFY